MTRRAIVPVVEGKAEEESVPILLRRIIRVHDRLSIARPWRVHRNRIVRDGELENVLQAVYRLRGDCGAILILLDADDDCPAALGPQLQARADRAALANAIDPERCRRRCPSFDKLLRAIDGLVAAVERTDPGTPG
ncbi:MAG: hypothetical protein JXP34_19505 [Planctomycetes bacterium]|nr:hypothetical protein [Planctomycetota bacterium]